MSAQQIIPEGDFLLSFIPDTCPEEIFIESALTGEVPARLVLDEITEFGQVNREDQLWISIRSNVGGGIKPRCRINFLCGQGVQLMDVLQGFLDGVSGRTFKKEKDPESELVR